MRLIRNIVGVVALVAVPLIAMTVVATMGMDEAVQYAAAGIGFIVVLIVFAVVVHFGGYLLIAGQVAMITKGVAEGDLPADVYGEGKRAVKRNFVRASAFYGLWNITKAITNQISSGMNALARSVDGSNATGPASIIASIVSTIVSVVLEYLNYCSLGWVFLHEDQSAFKSTCDGAVIYFQNWKTLMKNAGKVIFVTLVSLAIIGGAFFGVAYLLLSGIEPLTSVLSEIDAAATLEDGTTLPAGTTLLVLCGIIALILWSSIHGAFIKPYLLVSVMRRYIEVGRGTTPQVDVYEKLSGMSKGFRHALDQAGSTSVPAA